jgi:hypothetical protein
MGVIFFNNLKTKKSKMRNDDYNTSEGGITFVRGFSIGSVILIFISSLVVLGMWGCPTYNVYSAKKAGEAVLAHAQSSREVAVAEAKAKMESASLLAQADTIRAHGIAESNKIIGESLKDNPQYLQWLWIDQMKDQQKQIIYVPSSNLGLPILEANRLKTQP